MTRIKEGTKQVLQRVPVGLLAEIDAEATRHGVSRTVLINLALREYLEREAHEENVKNPPTPDDVRAVGEKTIEKLDALIDAVQELGVIAMRRVRLNAEERRERMQENARAYAEFIEHEPARRFMEETYLTYPEEPRPLAETSRK